MVFEEGIKVEMIKVKRGVFAEIVRSLGTLSSRLSDPAVLLLMLLSAALALHFQPQVNFESCAISTPHCSNSSSYSSRSRFHIEAYPMPGPIRLEHFTLDGKVPTHPWPRNDVGVFDLSWSSAQIEGMVSLAGRLDHRVNTSLCSYGEGCNKAFFQALTSHPVEAMDVLVVGSVTPWLESICLSFRANSTTTVDFNPPTVDHPRMKSITISDLDSTDQVFDAVFSYSSLEHDGLGRYGDPLNPQGDFLRMRKLMALLRPGGKLYLGVPNGPDFLLFNAHRVYGALRFPKLIQGWKLLNTFGEDLESAFVGNFKASPMCFPEGLEQRRGCYTQPVHVLVKL